MLGEVVDPKWCAIIGSHPMQYDILDQKKKPNTFSCFVPEWDLVLGVPE